MNRISPEQLLELEHRVRVDPGAACFAALAEAYRRGGRLSESEEVARQGLERKPDALEGRLVLALALLDQGDTEQARFELECLTPGVLAAEGIDVSASEPVPDAGLTDSELDDAFESAETDTDQLIDPNRVAEEAVAHVDAGAEGLDILEPGSDFATATMAELLEAQGDESGARRIRAALDSEEQAAPMPSREEDVRREQLIGTLESWLANLRGDVS